MVATARSMRSTVSVSTPGRSGIGETDAPWRALRPRADRPYLAHIDQRRRQARAAQQLDDAVGGIALRDAVQRDRRAAPASVRSGRRRTSRPAWPTFASASASFCGEGPFADPASRTRNDPHKAATAAAPSDRTRRRSIPAKASEAFSSATMSASGATRMPVRLRVEIAESGRYRLNCCSSRRTSSTQRVDQPFGLGPVRVMDLDRHLRAERRSVPPHGIVGLGRSATGQKCRSGMPSQR